MDRIRRCSFEHQFQCSVAGKARKAAETSRIFLIRGYIPYWNHSCLNGSVFPRILHDDLRYKSWFFKWDLAIFNSVVGRLSPRGLFFSRKSIEKSCSNTYHIQPLCVENFSRFRKICIECLSIWTPLCIRLIRIDNEQSSFGMLPWTTFVLWDFFFTCVCVYVVSKNSPPSTHEFIKCNHALNFIEVWRILSVHDAQPLCYWEDFETFLKMWWMKQSLKGSFFGSPKMTMCLHPTLPNVLVALFRVDQDEKAHFGSCLLERKTDNVTLLIQTKILLLQDYTTSFISLRFKWKIVPDIESRASCDTMETQKCDLVLKLFCGDHIFMTKKMAQKIYDFALFSKSHPIGFPQVPSDNGVITLLESRATNKELHVPPKSCSNNLLYSHPAHAAGPLNCNRGRCARGVTKMILWTFGWVSSKSHFSSSKYWST